jgi:hypothetical protein
VAIGWKTSYQAIAGPLALPAPPHPPACRPSRGSVARSDPVGIGVASTRPRSCNPLRYPDRVSKRRQSQSGGVGPQDWPETVSRLREVLVRIALQSPGTKDLIEEALSLLQTGDRAVLRPPAPAPAIPSARKTRGDKVVEYCIEPGMRGLSLVEVRVGSSKPFRCPEDVYRATVAILARETSGISFEDLHEAAMTRLGRSDEPIYLFRVVLRFLKQKNLLQHSGRRFRPKQAKGFKEAAARAWRETGRVPLRPCSFQVIRGV